MESGPVLTKLADVLHAIAQALLIPDIILLLAFIAYALFCIGSIVVEAVTERKNYKVVTPKFLASLMSASDAELPGVIKGSGLLNRQKQALLTVYDYRMLPGDSLVALIRKLVNKEETHYARITARNNTAAKIAPMAGLMGTLIPLGPGVAALGTGETATLSSSLLIAFDTTVAGLIVAMICLAVGKIRSNWYNDYMTTLDSGMATMLQKIEDLRSAGKIVEKTPSNYAFLFEQGLKKDKAKKGAAQAPVSQPTQQPHSGMQGQPRPGVQAGQMPSTPSAPQAAQPAQQPRPGTQTGRIPSAASVPQAQAARTQAQAQAQATQTQAQAAQMQTQAQAAQMRARIQAQAAQAQAQAHAQAQGTQQAVQSGTQVAADQAQRAASQAAASLTGAIRLEHTTPQGQPTSTQK